jgi:hypothetical protein
MMIVLLRIDISTAKISIKSRDSSRVVPINKKIRHIFSYYIIECSGFVKKTNFETVALR